MTSALIGLSARVRSLETREIMAAVDTVANLNANYPAGIIGRIAFATNGRKYILGVLEGVGAGTGTLVYDDGTNWIATASDSAVLA